jgi:hypothetical protein
MGLGPRDIDERAWLVAWLVEKAGPAWWAPPLLSPLLIEE